MANLIAPTSSRENRKRPTNVPLSVAFTHTTVNGEARLSLSDEADADTFLVDDGTTLALDDTVSTGKRLTSLPTHAILLGD